MDYNTVTEGLSVSRIGLGTMTFGQQNTEAEAHVQLDAALDAGVTLIDAAEMYPVPGRAETQGRTEAYIGSWLASRPGVRDRVVLATKVAGPNRHLTWLRDGSLRLDRQNIEAAIDASLKRLQTDHVDLYQLHWPDRKGVNMFGRLGYQPQGPKGWDEQEIPLADTLSVLKDLVTAGKVRYVGLSNETPWGLMHSLRLARELGLPRVVTIQNPYNLLNRTFEVGLSEVCLREGVGLLAYSPLAFGLLTGKYDASPDPAGRLALFPEFGFRYQNAQAAEASRRYNALAREHGLTPAQMALAFVNAQPFVASNLIGATTMAQLGENLQSLSASLSAELREQIEIIHREIPNPSP